MSLLLLSTFYFKLMVTIRNFYYNNINLSDFGKTLNFTAENVHWTKISPYLYIIEIFCGINICPCSDDYHRLYVIINTGQNIGRINISPVTARDENGGNSLQAKISGYALSQDKKKNTLR